MNDLRNIDTITRRAQVSSNSPQSDNQATLYTPPQPQKHRTTVETKEIGDDIPRRVVNSASMDSLMDRTVRNSISGAAIDLGSIELDNNSKHRRKASDGWSIFEDVEGIQTDKMSTENSSSAGDGQPPLSPDLYDEMDEDLTKIINDLSGLSTSAFEPASSPYESSSRPGSSKSLGIRDEDDWFVGEDVTKRASKASYHKHRRSAPSGSSILSEGGLTAELLQKTIAEEDARENAMKDKQDGSGEQAQSSHEKISLRDPLFLSKVSRVRQELMASSPTAGSGSAAMTRSQSATMSGNSTPSSSSSSRPGTAGQNSMSRPLASLPAAAFQNSSRNYVERRIEEAIKPFALRTYRSTSSLSSQYAQPAATGPSSQGSSNNSSRYASQPTTPFAAVPAPFSGSVTSNPRENEAGSSGSAAPPRHHRGLSFATVADEHRSRPSSNSNRHSRNFSAGVNRHSVFQNAEASTSHESLLPSYSQATSNNPLYAEPTGTSNTRFASLDILDNAEMEQDFDGRLFRTPSTPRRNLFSRIFNRSATGLGGRRMRSRQNSIRGDAPPPYEDGALAQEGGESSSSSSRTIFGSSREPQVDCRSCDFRFPVSHVVKSPACGCTYCQACIRYMFVNAIKSALSHGSSSSPSSSNSSTESVAQVPVTCCSLEVPIELVSEPKIITPNETRQYLQLIDDLRSERDHIVALQVSGVVEQYQKCPRAACGYAIERDGGNLHMTCICGTQFCFKCGGFWGHCESTCPGDAVYRKWVINGWTSGRA